MEVKKVHWIVNFEQKSWLKQNIFKNTKKEKQQKLNSRKKLRN